MRFSAPIPILRSFDEGKAREFYIDWLGFKVDWAVQERDVHKKES
jgi:hypothetical protein